MAGHILTRDDEFSEFSIQGPDNLGPHLNRVVWALVVLSGLFLGLRLYCKIWRRREVWWDDHFLIASWISLVVSASLQSVGVHHGLGKHYYDLTPEAIDAVALFSISAGFGSVLATSWSKTSFAISLLRISSGWMETFLWFIIISVNIVFAGSGTIQWVQCWPVQKLWNSAMEEGECLPPQVMKNFWTFVSVYSGTMDIVLALVPWKVIWAVGISKREKIGAGIAMSLGVFAGIMSFLKILTLYVIRNDNATTVDLMIFGTAEPATAIMAASMPILRVFFRQKPSPGKTFIELSEDGRVVARSLGREKKEVDSETFSV